MDALSGICWKIPDEQASRLVRLDPDTVTMEMVSTLIPEDIDEPQLPQKEERRVLGFCA